MISKPHIATSRVATTQQIKLGSRYRVSTKAVESMAVKKRPSHVRTDTSNSGSAGESDLYEFESRRI